MNQGRIIVITGSPGTGKTTTASIVAKESDMDKIAEFIYLCATDFENSAEKIKAGVTEICQRYPIYE